MNKPTLKKLFISQFKIGSLGFGGPLATMSLMKTEFVDEKKYCSEDTFYFGLACVKMCPGPVATGLATFLGYEMLGVWGALVSPLGFILPAFLMLLGISYFEPALKSFVSDEKFSQLMTQLTFIVLGIISWVCLKMFLDAWNKKYAGKRRPCAVVFFVILSTMLYFLHLPEIFILFVCALSGLLFSRTASFRCSLQVAPLSIFLIFLQASFSVFGSGYMALPYLERILVKEQGFLSVETFLRAVTYGNLTPGPVVIASTYMGFHMQGFWGACAATAGIFLGPIIVMTVIFPFLKKFRSFNSMEFVLMGLLPAVAITIFLSIAQMSRGLTWDSLGFAFFLGSLFLQYRGWSGLKTILVLGSVLIAVLVFVG